MKESEKYRFWNFSRGERFAVILLLCSIAILLVVRFYGTTRQAEPETSDFEQFETEISDFKKQISIKKDTIRHKKNSVMRKQTQKVTRKQGLFRCLPFRLRKLWMNCADSF